VNPSDPIPTDPRAKPDPAEREEAAQRPDFRFAFSHPWHAVSLFGGAGALRPGPGTWGTLAAWLTFVGGSRLWGEPVWIALILVGLYFGAWAAQRTGQALGKPDHGAIVIDEVVAFWIVLLLTPSTLAWQAAAFVVFRFFDITKPPPIRQLDRRFKNGVGVMLDDLLAGFYTLVVIAIGVRVLA